MSAAGVVVPLDLRDLRRDLERHPKASLVSGGTLEVPSWQVGGPPQTVIYLPRVREMGGSGPFGCGAACTLAQLGEKPFTPSVLRAAAASVGGPALRTLASVGGNVAAARPGCVAVALLAIDARAHVLAVDGGIQSVPLSSVLGVAKPVVVGFTWPRVSRVSVFQKATLLCGAGPAIATVAVSAAAQFDEIAWLIGVGATGVPPHRLPTTENVLTDTLDPDAAAECGSREIRIADDLIDKAHRRHVVGVLLRRAVVQVLREVRHEN